MNPKEPKNWLDVIEDKYYWVESLSCWLMALCFIGGLYLLFKDRESYYAWLLLKTSFVFLFITLFYKAVIYAVIYIGIKIKVKKGILELKDPVGDTVHEYVKEKNRAK